MRESAVGMKCPDCARQPRVRPSSPGRYLAAAGAGVGTATLVGALLVVGRIGMFGLLVPLIAGFAVGEVVSRMAHRLGGTGFQVIAAASTAAGLALGATLVGRVPAMVVNGPMIVFILIASAVAAVRVGR
jgi:hypothetical protein